MSDRRYTPLDGLISALDDVLRTSQAATGKPRRARSPDGNTRDALLDAHAAVTAREGIQSGLEFTRNTVRESDSEVTRKVHDAMHASGTTPGPGAAAVYLGGLGLGHLARLAGPRTMQQLRRDTDRRTRDALSRAGAALEQGQPGQAGQAELAQQLNRTAASLGAASYHNQLPRSIRRVLDKAEAVGRFFTRYF